MFQFSTLLFLNFQPIANAEAPFKRAKPWKYERYFGEIDRVEYSGTTELPLYYGIDGSSGAYTALSFEADDNQDQWLVSMSTSLPFIIVSEKFAGAMGAEVKTTNKKLLPIWEEYKLGGQIDYATFDTLTIGNITLHGVTALVDGSDSLSETVDASFSSFDLIIGLPLLETAYEILPSEGVIRLGDSSDGSQAVSSMGTSPIDYSSYSGGKVKVYKEGAIINSWSMIVDTVVDGKEHKAALGYTLPSSMTTPSADKEAISYTSDFKVSLSNVTVGDHAADIEMLNSDVLNWGLLPFQSYIGPEFFFQFDIAVDPSNQQLALRPVDGQHTRASFLPAQLEMAQAAFESSDSDENGESSEPSASDWGNLSAIQMKLGMAEDALNSVQNQIELDPNNCQYWLEASKQQLKLEKVDDAKNSAKTASELYHSWWDLNLNTRLDIQAAQEKMSEEEQDAAKEEQKGLAADASPVWHYSQSSDCHTSDAQLAWTHIVQEDLKSIESIYREYLDLDENLALAMGYTALVQRNMPLAQESLRQAIRLGGYTSKSEMGLALMYADIGDWEQASLLFDEASSPNSLDGALEMDNYLSVNGPKLAVRKAKAAVELNPMDTAANYLFVRELKRSGRPGKYDEAVASAEKVFQAHLNNIPVEGPLNEEQYEFMAEYARYLLITSRPEKSETIIMKLLETQQFSHSSIRLAYSDLLAYNGKMDEALAELLKLRLDGVDISTLSSAVFFQAAVLAE